MTRYVRAGGARVTLVVNNVDEGSETFLHSLAAALRCDGHQVVVHGMLDGRAAMPADRAAYDGATLTRALPAWRSPRFVPAAARLAAGDPGAVVLAARRARRCFGASPRAARAAALAAPLLAGRPDVVHLGFSGIGVALLDALELLEGVRVVVSCRGTGELVRPALDPAAAAGLASLVQRVDALHAVSDAVAGALLDAGAPAERVTVIRPAIDAAALTRRAPRRPIGEPVRLVTVARLHWVKALDLQLAAVAKLHAHGYDTRLRVVGGGPELDALRYRARVMGLDRSVELLGPRPRAEVVRILEESDVFVLSSLSEGTSNAALEAMALEVPVVSTSVGGMPEVITDGVDGALVPAGDADSIARAVVRLLHDPPLADRLASNGRRRVVEGFSSERQRREFSELYASVSAAPCLRRPGDERSMWGRA